MLRRLRKGEWIVIFGLIGLAVTLFLRWFNVEIAVEGLGASMSQTADRLWDASAPAVAVDSETGWGALGRPWMDVLIVAAVAAVVSLVAALRARPGRPTYGAVVSLVVAGAITALVTLLTAIRGLLARPSEAENLADGIRVVATTTPALGTWIGLASLIVMLVGLWIAIADDRTDAPDSAFDPPAPRPVP